MEKMTPNEIEEFAKSQVKWNELSFVEKIWEEIHKNIRRKCTNCQRYPICLQEEITKKEACENWFLNHKVFEGIVEKYKQIIKEKQKKEQFTI